MQRILKLTLLMIILITLTSCALCPEPKTVVVTKVKTVRLEIPAEYLVSTVPPSSLLLKDVKVIMGSEHLVSYLKELYDAWFGNSLKIKAIRDLSLEDENTTRVRK